VVPDVLGMPEVGAVSAVQAVGLAATVKRVTSAMIDTGMVGYQFPEAEASVPPGSGVLIVVSKGPGDVTPSARVRRAATHPRGPCAILAI
jgi:beta-lactam-binding protein with PASTA domain